MSLPVYKIETWNGGLNYTITDALEVYTKEVITDSVGVFYFIVPTKKDGSSYYYNDIAIYDKVKVWFGYDSISGNPNFVGRVANISAPLSTDSGYIRVINGFSQGEILQRRFKRNKIWLATQASTLVTELATDLGLGTGQIETDTTQVNMQVETKSYFDILRDVSDYWYSAGTQIKKDFMVDINNNLVWKTRPLRTSGVETLTVGSNIIYYNVSRDVNAVKNYISVYGDAGKIGIPGRNGRTEPSNGDLWTLDSPSNWTADKGSISESTSNPKVGSNYLNCDAAYDGSYWYETQFRRDISGTVFGFGKGKYQTVNFYSGVNYAIDFAHIRIYAPDSSNYYYKTITPSVGDWAFLQLQLGENQEYDAETNPTAPWYKVGSPTWDKLSWITFYARRSADFHFFLDGLYFGHGRFRDTVEDATSQSTYGRRDLEIFDETLLSDSDCTKRGQTLLYQKKDVPVQIDVTVPGNTNILVGDRVSMTIPAEGISTQPYDIIAVEHFFNENGGFITKAVIVNSVNIRQPLTTDANKMLGDMYRQLRQLTIDRKIIS